MTNSILDKIRSINESYKAKKLNFKIDEKYGKLNINKKGLYFVDIYAKHSEQELIISLLLDSTNIKNIVYPTHEMCMISIIQNLENLKLIKDPPIQLCIEAYKISNHWACLYVDYLYLRCCLPCIYDEYLKGKDLTSMYVNRSCYWSSRGEHYWHYITPLYYNHKHLDIC